jgi:ABC-type protease/lipase transport system fused ATPase/permease subunit
VSLFINLLSLAVPFFLLQVIDAVIPTRSSETLILLTIFFSGALICFVILEALRGSILSRIGIWLDRNLSSTLFRRAIGRAASRSRSRSDPGLSDLWALRGFLTGPSVNVVLDLPWLPLFIAIIFFLSPLLGWMTVIGAVIMLAIAAINDIATRRLSSEAGDLSDDALEHAQMVMRNASVVETMCDWLSLTSLTPASIRTAGAG